MIRVENIIRSDITTELHEILELYCELLLARAGLLDSSSSSSSGTANANANANNKECDPGLEEAVRSIIYAAPRTEIKELHQVRQLLVEKFGKDFALDSMDDRDGKVSERVKKKLSVTVPERALVEGYLKEVARSYGVDWPKKQELLDSDDEEERSDDNDDDKGGGQAIKESRTLEAPLPAKSDVDASSKATPSRETSSRPSYARSPVSVTAPSPSTDNVRPKIKIPKPTSSKRSGSDNGSNAGKNANIAPKSSMGEEDEDDDNGDDSIEENRQEKKEEEGEKKKKMQVAKMEKEQQRDRKKKKSRPTKTSITTTTTANSGTATGRNLDASIPDVDELLARFAALK